MENKSLANVLVLLSIFVQECFGYCRSYDSDCNNGFEIYRVWYLWVVIIIVISLCCGGCGVYRRRRYMMQQQTVQTVPTVIVGGPVATTQGTQGQVNYGYNQGPAAAMGPPSYSAAAASPTTYPPPAGSAYPPTLPTAPGAPVYNIYGDPEAANNKSALPSEPPPAYNEAIKPST